MRRILVIADDFSGAAEMAGIGLRFGLPGRIVRGDDAVTPMVAGLTVVDTDSRDLPAADAAARVARAIRALAAAEDALLFKKIDSVLRGPVVAEIDAALAATGRATALVVPANPSRGRVIRGGRYYVHGVSLELTEFARDPVDPARTAYVVERVGGAGHVYGAGGATALRPGIALGDVQTAADVRAWAAGLRDCLPVGGADFFTAFLEHAGFAPAGGRPAAEEAGARAFLLVCGTASAGSHAALNHAEQVGAAICNMPAAVFGGTGGAPAEWRTWRDAILRSLNDRSCAIAAVRHPLEESRVAWVAQQLTEVVAETLVARPGPCELFVEGGATASHLAQCMGWREFSAARELAPGVVRLAIVGEPNRWMTIKPGSYSWPAEVWDSLR